MLKRAQFIALLLPSALMTGALGSQYLGGLVPCEMCWWQRWPHYAAIALAALAFIAPQGTLRRILIAGAAGGILTSGLIGIYHAGVEYHLWLGPTRCTGQGGHTLDELFKTKIVMCDQPQWTLFGISLAGFNALISVTGALYIFNLLRSVEK
jgi:disulfide bond formation protein DsbB